MTKGQFALVTTALGLVVMAGAGYVGYAHADSGRSSGSSASGSALGAGQNRAAGSDGAAGQLTATGAANPGTGTGLGGAGTQTSTPAPECGNADLQVSQASSGGGAGHLSLLIEFTNTSDHRCYMRGYPGASMFGPEGAVLANATRTLVGSAGGAVGQNSPPRVVLQPNGTASAIVEWSDVPTGSGGCLNPVSLGVTPPDTKQTTNFELSGQPEVCSSFEVHPVLAGVAYSG